MSYLPHVLLISVVAIGALEAVAYLAIKNGRDASARRAQPE